MAANLDFTAAKVKRGSLVNYRTGDTLEFDLNPSDVKVTQSASIAEDNIPGFADPLLRWISGKAKKVSFSLQNDGDIRVRRGRKFANAATMVESAAPATVGTGKNTEFKEDPEGYSIAAYLEFLDHFLYPANPTFSEGGDAGRNLGADLVIFNFGSYFRGGLYVVEDVNHDIIEFSPELLPTKAKSDIVLKEYVIENTWAHDIFEAK